MSDTVRDEVRQLAAWSPLPPEAAWDDRVADLYAFTQDAQRVRPPITTDERILLLSLLDRPDEDSLYGLLQLIVTLVESAPQTGWEMELPTQDRPWFEYLRVRWMNHLDMHNDEP